MSTNLPKKAKDIKGSVAIAELRRAHFIIAILALSFSVMIGFVSAFELKFNAILGICAIVLLILVASVSLATVVALRNR